MIDFIENGPSDAGYVYFVVECEDTYKVKITANYRPSPELNIDKDLYQQIGYSSIDIVRTFHRRCLLCVDDDGYAKHLSINPIATALYPCVNPILGTVVLGSSEWLPFQEPDIYAFPVLEGQVFLNSLVNLAKIHGF